MKKFMAYLMCGLICLSLCACSSEKAAPDTSSSGISYEEQTSSDAETSSEQSSSPEDTSSKPKPQTSSKNNNSKNTNSKNTNSKNTSSKKNNIINNRPIDNWLTPNPWPNTSSNGSPATSSYYSPEPEYVPGVDYGAIAYQGELVEMVCDKDMVYIICKNPNILVAYDSNSFQIKNYVTLSGSPAEIHLEGQQIQISLPNLQRINTYDKNSLEQVESLVLPDNVTSFCFDGDLVYYSNGDKGCNIYRTNIVTEETVQLPGYPYASKTFSNPKLLLNKEKGILYIGESNSNNSALFYYKTSDFSCLYKSETVNNGARTMFLVNDKLYWGPMILDPVNPAGSEEYYMITSTKSELWHVDEKYIVNTDKIHERISPMKTNEIGEFAYAVVTESENLVVSYADTQGKFIFSFPKGIYKEYA